MDCIVQHNAAGCYRPSISLRKESVETKSRPKGGRKKKNNFDDKNNNEQQQKIVEKKKKPQSYQMPIVSMQLQKKKTGEKNY